MDWASGVFNSRWWMGTYFLLFTGLANFPTSSSLDYLTLFRWWGNYIVRDCGSDRRSITVAGQKGKLILSFWFGITILEDLCNKDRINIKECFSNFKNDERFSEKGTIKLCGHSTLKMGQNFDLYRWRCLNHRPALPFLSVIYFKMIVYSFTVVLHTTCTRLGIQVCVNHFQV